MSERAAVTVVGIGDDGWDGLTETARAALRQAPVIVGSTAPAGAAARPRRSAAQPLPSPLLAQLDDLVARRTRPVRAGQRRPDAARHRRDARPPPGRRPAAGAARGVERRAGLRPARLGRARGRRRLAGVAARSRWSCRRCSQAVAADRRCAATAAPRPRWPGCWPDRGWGDSELTVLEHLGRRGRAGHRARPGRGASGRRPRSPTCPWWPWSCAPGPRRRRAAAGPRAARRRLRERRPAHPPRGPGAGPGRARAPDPGSCCGTSGAGSGSIGIEWMRADAALPRGRGRSAAPTGPSGSAATPPPSASPAWRSSAATRPGRAGRACPGRTRCSSAAASPPTACSRPAGQRLRARRPAGRARGHRRVRGGAAPLAAGRRAASWCGWPLSYAGPARRVHRLAARAAGHPVAGDPAMTVWFVGAGPGAPDLLTVRAQRLLADRAGRPVRRQPGPARGAGRHPARARGWSTPPTWTSTRSPPSWSPRTRDGHDVVRLHSGDPSIFSAVAEQARRLDAAGVPWQIVPGVPGVRGRGGGAAARS